MAEDHWNASAYEAHARFVTDLAGPVVALLDPVRGERILDLGCGDGPLTRALADHGCEMVGVDASADMVARAVARGVDARAMDGHELSFDAEFDAVFSNAALHWMTRPDAVIAGAARALKPGGRFVAEQGGHGNVAAIRTAMIAVLTAEGIETDLTEIWSFPSVPEQARRLEAAGFVVEECAIHPRPTPVKAGIEAWLTTLAAPAMALLPEPGRAAACARVAALVAPALRDGEGDWTADYTRLRFRAVKR
ncbi:MAG: class I SAM-dependent methyltransferase [Paracoccaceae bacterium]